MRPKKRGKDQPSRVSQKGKENNEEKKLRKTNDSNIVWKLPLIASTNQFHAKKALRMCSKHGMAP